MMKVRIEENTALNLLMDRLTHWTDDSITTELFEQYYQEAIDCGALDGATFDPMVIVDNDYINWFRVMDEHEIRSEFNENPEDTADRVYATVHASGENYYLVYMC